MAPKEILDRPPLPARLLDVIKQQQLVIFIGAGVSRLMGCKGWDQLASNMLEACYQPGTDGRRLINFREKDSLLRDPDHKRVITITYHLLKRAGKENLFLDKLRESLQGNQDLIESRDIYGIIWDLRCSFVTTNADRLFHKYFRPSQIVYRLDDFKSETKLLAGIKDLPKLYHIHGLIDAEETPVFTVRDYILRYQDPGFLSFLTYLFNNYNILFLGYGMAEFELLDFLIPKGGSDGRELKHFALLPYYKGEENILSFHEMYYTELGIEVCPYAKDENGYHQLYDVLVDWSREINQVSPWLYHSFKQINDAINGYGKVDSVLQLIRNDEPQRNYFFKRLGECDNPLPWLHPLYNEGYLDPKNNPSPEPVKDGSNPDVVTGYTIPSWTVLDFLENVARKLSKSPLKANLDLLLQILDAIASYRDSDDFRIDNNRTDRAITRIVALIPPERLKLHHIDFVGEALRSKWESGLVASAIAETLLPKLVQSGAGHLLKRLLPILLRYTPEIQEFGEHQFMQFKPGMEFFWLAQALDENLEDLLSLEDLDILGVLIDAIRRIHKEDPLQFSGIPVPAIEDDIRLTFEDQFPQLLIRTLRDLLDKCPEKTVENYVDKVVALGIPILHRITIHAVNVHYGQLSHLFWNWPMNPLDERYLAHEVHKLLRDRSKDFNGTQIKQILDWIESAEYDVVEDPATSTEKQEARQKRRWLEALLDTDDDAINQLYDKYKAISPEPIVHPDFISHVETGSGHTSPLDTQTLGRMSSKEIAQYMDRFVPEPGSRGGSKQGLADMFKAQIVSDPSNVMTDLTPFLNVDKRYQYSLLWGLYDAYQSGHPVKWNALLYFFSSLVDSDAFWTQTTDHSYTEWIVGQIADILGLGAQNERCPIPEALIISTTDVLTTMVQQGKQLVKESPDPTDLVTWTLNSHMGRIYQALMFLAFRETQDVSGKQLLWTTSTSIKRSFTSELDVNSTSPLECFVVLGRFLSNLYRLDPAWVTKHVDKILPQGHPRHWEATMTGYLYYGDLINKELYVMLKKHGHYSKALNTRFLERTRQAARMLVQHMCVGYLEDWELLDEEDSLLRGILHDANPTQLKEVVSYFWVLRKRLTPQISAKARSLWAELHSILERRISETEYRAVASELIRWLVLFDKLDDEIVEWCSFAAQYADIGFNKPWLVEYLLPHSATRPDLVGKIYLKALGAGVYPEYKQEQIRELATNLYEGNQTVAANRICNTYGAKGFDFLEDIYRKYNE